jgi:hypothetical protein
MVTLPVSFGEVILAEVKTRQITKPPNWKALEDLSFWSRVVYLAY